MSDTLSQQHPAVVLRSHYVHVRALLAIAMIAVVGLATAVVVLATNGDDAAPVVRTAAPVDRSTISNGGIRYDGGPDEGGAGTVSAAPPSRYDGGPEEGTRGLGH